ncbi:MAG: hypothetical protein ABI661_12590 [Gammaproteobacteria bacterium]
MNARLVRSLSAAALPLVTGGWLAAAAAEDSAGPRYSYLDAGYQWTDVNYAVKQEGGSHKGIKLNGSVGLFELGPVGLHLFGEFFDGNFSGVHTSCDGGEGGSTSFSGDRNSQSIAGGLGLSYAITEKTDVVVRAAYVDISDFEVPDNACQLVSVDDHGYFGEAVVRSELSENVEIEAGVRYSDLSDAGISNTDVLLGIGYHVTDYLTVRARGVVFDDDTGIEIGARLYFGSFLGRDTLF